MLCHYLILHFSAAHCVLNVSLPISLFFFFSVSLASHNNGTCKYSLGHILGCTAVVFFFFFSFFFFFLYLGIVSFTYTFDRMVLSCFTLKSQTFDFELCSSDYLTSTGPNSSSNLNILLSKSI